MDWEAHFRGLNASYSAEYPRMAVGGFFDDAWHVLTTPVQEQVADFTLAKDNLIAINDYMHRIPPKTDKARDMASDWSRWWITTGDPNHYTVQIPQPVLDEARNRRIQYDLANATSKEERDLVIHVATTGMSSEQMQGKPDRRDPTTGLIFVEPEPPKPMLPSWTKPVFIGALALGVGLSIVPALRKFILPF